MLPPLSNTLPSLHFHHRRRISYEPFSLKTSLNFHLFINPFLLPSCTNAKHSSHKLIPPRKTSNQEENPTIQQPNEETQISAKPKKNFWTAVSLIIGTAVGPGMLGLPSCTIKSGLLPSSLMIFLSWIYVISSILLVAELTFATMKEENLQEVSFTGISSNTLGANFGTFVAIVYACLSFSLMIACVSGIGSLLSKQFRFLNPILANSIFPIFIGVLIGFFPFKAIDTTNRLLCCLMLLSILTLVSFGISIGRNNILNSLNFSSWSLKSVLPAVPVTVLTLGFHVITPFICKIAGDTVFDARKAILIGGSVPLLMVLSWNAVIISLAQKGNLVNPSANYDPIKLLLSVNNSVLPAVQGFAFTALGTSLIGYLVSFPKQLADTVDLVIERFNLKNGDLIEEFSSERKYLGVTWLVLIVPVFIACFFSSAFAKALDFAGIYANCFLFGVLPPFMAWIHRSRSKRLSISDKEILPGGNIVLLLLFIIAVILGIWR
ncbi:hypothetical protein LUZ60_011323 [Juncus effusus]|nr:hypothetical protein LUZ60_011323 [Juncus effusus]